MKLHIRMNDGVLELYNDAEILHQFVIPDWNDMTMPERKTAEEAVMAYLKENGVAIVDNRPPSGWN